MKTKTNPNESVFLHESGLTKRELFAAMAMQGICARSWPAEKVWKEPFVEYVAAASKEMADELIAELNKKVG